MNYDHYLHFTDVETDCVPKSSLFTRSTSNVIPSGSPFEVVAKHISFRVQLCGLEGNLLIDCVTSGKLFHFLLYRIVPTFQDCYEIRIRCYK